MTHSAMLMIQPVAERFHGRGALCVIRTVSCRTSAHLLDPKLPRVDWCKPVGRLQSSAAKFTFGMQLATPGRKCPCARLESWDRKRNLHRYRPNCPMRCPAALGEIHDPATSPAQVVSGSEPANRAKVLHPSAKQSPCWRRCPGRVTAPPPG